MKLQRIPILVFIAALSAGTCAATPVVLSLNGNTGGTSQFGSLSIDGSLLGSLSGNGSTAFYQGTVDETDGWHTISIDYKDISGLNGITLFVNGGWASAVDLQSLDASGTPIHGLRGDFFTLAGSLVMTIYGDSEGPYLKYVGGSAPWSGGFNGGSFGPSTVFEETLTGKIYFGPDPAPALDSVTSPTDPDGGAAPEPASWWLAAAALPLILFSKFRLNRAKTL